MSSTTQNLFEDTSIDQREDAITTHQVQDIVSVTMIASKKSSGQSTMSIRSPIFKAGDRVYYNLPDNEMGLGLVISSAYYIEENEFSYLVSWGGEFQDWYSEVELSNELLFT